MDLLSGSAQGLGKRVDPPSGSVICTRIRGLTPRSSQRSGMGWRPLARSRYSIRTLSWDRRPRSRVIRHVLGLGVVGWPARRTPTQTFRRSHKVEPPKFWTPQLLWCRLWSPKVDLLFGSAQGSRRVVQQVYPRIHCVVSSTTSV